MAKKKNGPSTKTRTNNSLYGQIALLGRYHGSLKGKTITLLVKFDRQNNKREYTVQEALPLISQWNKQREQKGERRQPPESPFQQSTEIKEEPPGGFTKL